MGFIVFIKVPFGYAQGTDEVTLRERMKGERYE